MALKFFVILALATVAYAHVVPESATVVEAVEPLVQHVEKVVEHGEDYDAHPQYRYAYDVQDSASGDSKSQVEERDGDVVRGEYSLVDADGYKRTVQYTADPINGFQADVHREPFVSSVLPTIVKTVAPVAPTVVETIAPVTTYSAPTLVRSAVPFTQYAAPVTHYTPSTYSAPATYASQQYVRSVLPVARYAYAPSVYTSYSAPTTYVTHH